ncbi:MAG: DUF721 domain-containing protein [Nonlabens sp.]
MRNNKKEDFLKMSEALNDFKSQKKLARGFERVNIETAWKDVMGPGIVKYTTGMKFTAGTLIVNLSSSVLREELMYGRSKIIENLNEYLKQDLVTKIVLR